MARLIGCKMSNGQHRICILCTPEAQLKCQMHADTNARIIREREKKRGPSKDAQYSEDNRRIVDAKYYRKEIEQDVQVCSDS